MQPNDDDVFCSMKTPIQFTVFAGLSLCSALASAQIYTCVDAKGRKLTSDRSIPECFEREQKELNSNATVKRVVQPGLTEQEKRALVEKQKALDEEKIRAKENQEKIRAFVRRHPSRAKHDKERSEALGQIDQIIKAAEKRIESLVLQRKPIDAELEFYIKDPKKIPSTLKRQVDDHDNSVAVQKRIIVDQGEEKKRINARMDEELLRLTPLWAAAASPASQASPSRVAVGTEKK